MLTISLRIRNRMAAMALSVLILFSAVSLRAQEAGTKLSGTILDAQGLAISSATVTIKSISGVSKVAYTDANGAYSVSGLPAGNYTVTAVANGFAQNFKKGIALTAGKDQQVPLILNINAVMTQIEVNAGVDSIAAQTAPSGGFIEERSAQSLISNNYIRNFVSPIADYGEIVQIVPGAFTTSSDGVGLGQSKTYFRGFPDGNYDIDFDGVPFYDTNSPTHHSWAFFPGQWLGGVDFDRSPGSASTTGPTPFGGSIHLLSMPLSSQTDIRATASYSTWNTQLYDAAFNSGSFGVFGHSAKSNLFVDVHHMTSDGYQTFNFNSRDAGSLLYQYQFSPKTVLTAFTGVVHLYANTYGLNPTRCQTMVSTPSSLCANANTANGLMPFTGEGLNFMMVNNSDPANWLDNQYNNYRVPTDFEYVGIRSELGKGWYVEAKPYTYNYDNAELFTNAFPILDSTSAGVTNKGTNAKPAWNYNGSPFYLGVAVAPCDIQVAGKVSASTGLQSIAVPCGVDKYNSYRKYGETSVVSQTSKLGVFRTGLWYEWARTDRHQYPSDPVGKKWIDQALPNFAEQFWTNSYQPFAEYEFHVTPQFNITAGTKYAYYSFDVLHHADNGKTVGNLCPIGQTSGCPTTAEDTGTFSAWLPSFDMNYRFQPNWSAYLQVATGSIVPPSNVYDFSHTPTTVDPHPGLLTPPKQQRSTTYQAGTVIKLQNISFDADAYYIRFQNSYSSVIDPTTSETVNFLQPSSVTRGLEFETNYVVAPGLNLYLNATAANALYAGQLNAGSLAAPYFVRAPHGLWVSQTPADTEMEGLTYSNKGFDLGIFNKRVGEQRVDNGAYHNQAIINPFSTANTYLNYTVRNHSIFDQTKIAFSANNLLDQHSLTGVGLTGKAATQVIPGTTITDPFTTTAATPIAGTDTPSFMAGRSFSVSVTFGFAPRERK